LELFGNSTELTKRERVDGATVRNDFTRTIQDKGGDEKAQRDSTEAMTRELFDCNTKELYQGTGSKRGDRSTLPKEAQKAYIVGETVATHDLKAKDIKGSQPQKNSQIVDSVRSSSQKVRGLFPW
jgi:hypothetical protein